MANSVKNTTGTDLTLNPSWLGGAAPTAADVAVWVSGSLGGSLTLPASRSWQGINVSQAPTSAISVTGAGTLTIGVNGVIVDTSALDVTWGTPVSLGSNQTWNVGAGRVLNASGQLAGSGTLTKSGSGSLFLTGSGSTNSGAVTLNAGNLFLAGYNSGTPNQLAGVTTLTLSGGVLYVAGNTAYATFSTSISGSQDLYMINSSLGGVTFTGTSLSNYNGSLRLYGDSTTLGLNTAQKITTTALASSNFFFLTGGGLSSQVSQTLVYNGTSALAYGNAILILPQSGPGITAKIENASSNNTAISFSGTLSNNGTSAYATSIEFATTNANITYSGNITEASTGTLNLSKSNSNALTLSGSASTYKGIVSVTTGTLNANSATALGAATSTAGISVSSGATLSLGAALNYSSPGRTTTISGTGVGSGGALVHAFAGTANVGSINLGAASYVRGTASGTSILSSAITATTGPLTVGAASSNVLTLSGAISSNLTVTVANSSADTGEVLLSGVNGSLTGAITVNYGTLSFATQSAVGFAGTLTLTRFGTVVQFNSGTSTNRQITGRGEIRLKAAGAYAFGQINMPTGDGSAFGGNALGLTAYENATLTSGVYWPSTVYVSELYPKAMAGKTFTLQGVLDSHPSSSPYVYFIPEATGKVIVSGSNTYNGISFIYSGTTQVAAPESAGVSGPFGINTTSGAIQMSNTGVLQYSATNQFDYSPRLDTAGSQQWKIDTNGQTVTFATVLQGTSSTLTKSGTGTLLVTGTNTYTGSTSVSAGTLAAGNTQAFGTTGTVTIGASGAALQTLTTGGQNGKLTVANLTNSAGGTIRIGG